MTPKIKQVRKILSLKFTAEEIAQLVTPEEHLVKVYLMLNAMAEIEIEFGKTTEGQVKKLFIGPFLHHYQKGATPAISVYILDAMLRGIDITEIGKVLLNKPKRPTEEESFAICDELQSLITPKPTH